MDSAILIRDLEPFRQARPVWDRAAEMILLATTTGSVADIQEATRQLLTAVLEAGPRCRGARTAPGIPMASQRRYFRGASAAESWVDGASGWPERAAISVSIVTESCM